MDKKLSAVREEAIKAGLRKESISDLGYIDYPEVQLILITKVISKLMVLTKRFSV